MTTIDLNNEQRWEELFQRVEAGEIVRVTRGGREIAVVEPSALRAAEALYLDQLAEYGLQQLALDSPPDEFADWENTHGTR